MGFCGENSLTLLLATFRYKQYVVDDCRQPAVESSLKRVSPV